MRSGRAARATPPLSKQQQQHQQPHTITTNNQTTARAKQQDDGSGLFVTVARYRTPSGAEIDLKGIKPDLPCGGSGGRGLSGPRRRGGLPEAPELAAAWPADARPLASDRCLLAALDALQKQQQQTQMQTQQKGGPVAVGNRAALAAPSTRPRV